MYNGSFANPLSSAEYPNEYEINSTLQLNNASGGAYFHYLMAYTNAEQGAGGAATSATYYAVELYNPTFDSGGNCTATLNFWQNTKGSTQATRLSSVAVPCSSTTSMRTVAFYLPGSGIWKIWALINNYLYSYSVTPSGGNAKYPLNDDTSAIYPGVGAYQLPGTASGFSRVEFGPRSLIGATPVALSTVATKCFRTKSI